MNTRLWSGSIETPFGYTCHMADNTLPTRLRRATHARGWNIDFRRPVTEERQLSGIGSGGGEFDVGDYTPDGEALTPDNFEAAFRAALAAATALCDAPENATGNRGGATVLVPSGAWPMNEGVNIPGASPKYSPSIVGMGAPGSVVFFFNRNANFPGISLGTNENGTVAGQPHCIGVTLENLVIHFTGGSSVKGGIRARATIRCNLKGVEVRGAGQDDSGIWYDRVGFDFRNNNIGEVNNSGQNHQHLYIERCVVNYSFIGFWAGEGLWSCTAIDLSLNGCVHGLVGEGAVIGWFGGNVQGGDHQGSPVASGMTYTTGLPSGTGAAVTAVSNGLSTVTGLSGMEGFVYCPEAYSMKNSWLVLGTNIYRIESVLSATSCRVWRSNGGGSASGLAWEVRGCPGGNEITMAGNIYHETTDGQFYAMLGRDFTASSYWRLDGIETKVQRAVVSSMGATGQIAVVNCRPSGIKIAELDQTYGFYTDVSIGVLDSDDFSRNAIIARQPQSLILSSVWDGRPRGARYNSALQERGAIVFDARKENSFIKTGNNITNWYDLTDTIGLARTNPTQAPQYVAVDAGFNGPAVQLTGSATLANVAGLSANIGSFFPAGYHSLTLLVIARLPTASKVSGTRRVSVDGTNTQVYLGYDDTGGHSSDPLYGYFYMNGVGTPIHDLAPSETGPHWAYVTSMMSGTASLGAGSDVDGYTGAMTQWGAYRLGLTFPSTVTLALFPSVSGTPNGDLVVAHVAVLPHGLTIGERDAFLDLARNEFNIVKV